MISHIPMDRNELKRHAALLFGRDPHGEPKHGWRQKLAARIPGKTGQPITTETIRRWMRDDRVPDDAAVIIRAIAAIAPPPASSTDDDRDDACVDALEPEMTRLRDLAVASGWHRAEISAAILSLTVGEMLEGAGQAATLDALDQARTAVLMRR